MAGQIDPEIKIADLVERFPATKAVLEAHGLGALVTEEAMRVLAPFLSLGMALRSRSIAEQGFLRLLEEALEVEGDGEPLPLFEGMEKGKLTLLALMPCGLKMPFSKALSAFLEKWIGDGGEKISYAIEGNLNQELSYYSYIQSLESVEELPDILISSDFNAFYQRRFYEKYVLPGNFVPVLPEAAGPDFKKAAIPDPEKTYGVIGVNPLIVVADKRQVGDRPLPVSWDDMLDPMWEGSLCLRGNTDFFCHAVLLPIFQKHGEEGLRRLAANVHSGKHPAQMVKEIDGSTPGAALYVMPEFFAYKITRKERVEIIWPTEGALASPVTLMVKKGREEELKPVIDYLLGSELAQVFAGAHCPSPHPQASNQIPEHSGLKWLGWEFLREKDLSAVNREIDDIFLPAVGVR